MAGIGVDGPESFFEETVTAIVIGGGLVRE